MADEDKYKRLRELIEQQEAELDKGPEELWYNGRKKDAPSSVS